MALGVLAGVPALSGCGGHGEPEAGESRGAAVLTNNSNEHLALTLSINGKSLARTDAELLGEIVAGVSMVGGVTPARAFALGLWRYVVSNRRHTDPLTEQAWAHAPVVFLNAVGFGYCDDVASVLAALARSAGYEARVWALEGHVVPEIRVDGRWELYDPDLEVYYLNDAGLPAGVEELAANPTLIVAPRLAAAPAWAHELRERARAGIVGDVRYSQEVADIYASVADNLVNPAYDDPPYAPAAVAPLQLPPGATATLGLLQRPWLRTMYDTPLAAQGALRLALPAGTQASLAMPLVPVGLSGQGTVAVNGLVAAVDSDTLRARLADFDSPVTTIDVLHAEGILQIEYLLNDVRFDLGDLRSVQVGSSGAGAVSIEYLPTALP